MTVSSETSISFDPFDPYWIDRRFDVYRELREKAPVYHLPAGYWVVSRYEDVLAITLDTDRFSSLANQTEAFGLRPDALDEESIMRFLALAAQMPEGTQDFMLARTIVAADPPEHTRLRAIINRGFTPRRIAAVKAYIDTLIGDCLRAVDWSSGFDLVSRLAIPVPVRMISDTLSIDPARSADVRRWSDAIVEVQQGKQRGTPEAIETMITVFRESAECFVPLIDERRREPKDDLISDIVRAEDADAVTQLEAVLLLFTLMAAGNLSTSSLIGNLVVALLQHPDQLALLQEDPQLLPQAVEECLRWRSPFQTGYRMAMKDVEVAGTVIPQGGTVVLVWGAANHDPAHFVDPERFDLTRNDGGHLAFGHGIHFCVGAALGRAEAKAAITALLPHLGSLRLAEDPPPVLENVFAYGHQRIELVPR